VTAVTRFLASIVDRFRREERGSMLVEMALITPLMLSLSGGVFEFGNLIQKKLLIEAGLRDAARYVARCRPIDSTACNTAAQNLAATAIVASGGTARVAGWTAAAVTIQPKYISTSATDGSGNLLYRSQTANIYTVRVSTSFVYTGVSLLSYMGLGPITLTGSQEQRYIGW
jgi:Flp pilus assembly protein TadG